MIPILIINFFTEFFLNAFNDVMIILFVLIGLLIGLLFKPKARNQVMKILTRDRRFIDFDVLEETAFAVDCEVKEGFPPQRFIKLSPGYSGRVGRFLKKVVTRFIGKEGTAYTWETEKGTKKIGSLAKALKHLWGDETYNRIPQEQREGLEKSKVWVTVDLKEGITPKGMKSVSEEDLKREEDRKAAQTFWEGKRMSEKTAWIQWMFIFVAGMGAMAIASKFLGWW